MPNPIRGYPGFFSAGLQTPSTPIMVLSFLLKKGINSTHGLVARTSALHAEGRQLDPGMMLPHTRVGGSSRRLLNKTNVCGINMHTLIYLIEISCFVFVDYTYCCGYVTPALLLAIFRSLEHE
jgi:hypothetical protein